MNAADRRAENVERGTIAMTTPSTFTKGALAAVAGAMALGAAATAQAQPDGYYGNGSSPGYSNSDPCRRDANGRGVVGALVGGGIGATVGSQVAAKGHRTDGSVLGGVLGALAGAAVGHKTAACNDAPYPPPAEAAPPPPPPPAESSYYPPAPPVYYAPPPPRYAETDTVWVYGRHGVRYRVVEGRAGPDGCTFAESPVYMPDGRVDTRFVRVCPDYSGRYRIVD